MSYAQPAGLRSLEYRDGLSDTLTLMITAGADVYALNDDGISVSAIANAIQAVTRKAAKKHIMTKSKWTKSGNKHGQR
jgi:hypothetical protein